MRGFFSAPFQLVLVIAFSLVAAFTILIGAGAISRTIRDYLAVAVTERVERDMHLAQALYQNWLSDVAEMARHVVLSPSVLQNVAASKEGDSRALLLIEQELAKIIHAEALHGNHLVAVLDAEGGFVTGYWVSSTGTKTLVHGAGDWSRLPIVNEVLQSGTEVTTTEVIPSEVLETIGLAEQAFVPLLETPRAAETPFDPREGRAGLALISVIPIRQDDGSTVGLALALHLFNNDFTLVDQIKEVAAVDTATIFLGDLRVSTNVHGLDGKRAIGTRLSKEVTQVVLEQGRPYTGPAFVVQENYITRYEPLRDHAGAVIGVLYVGAREARFSRLVNSFNERVVLVALGSILATFLLAVPVSRVVTRPLQELRELAEANRRVARGDMRVRVPVRAGGDVGELASSFNAMLDQLQATQDQLVHSEKLAYLGQLAAGVAHGLNNPLATVLLFSDILLRECAPDDPRRADLEMIVNETRRCKGIVAALLDFARQNQVVAQATDLNTLVHQVLEVEKKRLGDAPITIVADLDPQLPIIEADPAQLQEVIANLVSNAIEAMLSGGKLTVRTRPGPEGMVTMSVTDTGVGITPEDQAKLFVPFFTTKPVGKGTGLGLAIVYGIVKMHRGQITVQSQPGKGTTFTVTLPMRLLPMNTASQDTRNDSVPFI